jgi:hypothetical protein
MAKDGQPVTDPTQPMVWHPEVLRQWREDKERWRARAKARRVQQAAVTPQAGTENRGGLVHRLAAPKSEPRHVGGDATPTAITEHPIIGKTSCALRAVRFLVSRASVDDGEVSEQPYHGVVLANVPHSGATPDLGDEGGTPDQRSNHAVSASSTERT